VSSIGDQIDEHCRHLRLRGMAALLEGISEKIIRRIMADEELTASSRRRRRYQSYQGEISPAVDNVID